MALKVIPRLQAFSSAICRTFVQYFNQISTDSALAQSLSDSWASCLHQWSCTVMEEGLYLRKTACVWLCGCDAAFVKLLWPLVIITIIILGLLFGPSATYCPRRSLYSVTAFHAIANGERTKSHPPFCLSAGPHHLSSIRYSEWHVRA